MINPREFVDGLRRLGAGIFTGVPDSLLMGFCSALQAHATRPGEHIIAANEGNAIGIAAGYHLATGGFGVVYMQNSGLGNAVNPLASLTDPEVYRVPMLLIVGWRGEPGVKDEPQHVKQGRITEGQLSLLEIPHWKLSAKSDVAATLETAIAEMRRRGAPVALLVHKGAFAECRDATAHRAEMSNMTREAAIRAILGQLTANDLLVSTTGKASREVFEGRKARGESQRDFLTVGSMGHTLSIALGVALGNPSKRVVCLDGDGSVLMHMGAMPVTAAVAPRNLLHVMLNNAAHESVGGQPTVADRVNFESLARSCGYAGYARADSEDGLVEAMRSLKSQTGPFMLEVRVAMGARDDLGRPTSTPEQNKQAFMEGARTGA